VKGVKAVVMAGGEGSRLRPLTVGRPKPMVPIVNKPVLGHILDLLKYHGIVDVVITLQYLPAAIQDYFGNGSNIGMNLRYVVEESPLGTAGGVKNAARHLDDTFLVISGDALTDFDLRAMLDFHDQAQALATLALYSVKDPQQYGVLVTDERGQIVQFLEKPDWSNVISDTVNTGIYVFWTFAKG
jgi:mannose-1-phosphate guanylyltransferase/phosphomannomutase